MIIFFKFFILILIFSTISQLLVIYLTYKKLKFLITIISAVFFSLKFVSFKYLSRTGKHNVILIEMRFVL